MGTFSVVRKPADWLDGFFFLFFFLIDMTQSSFRRWLVGYYGRMIHSSFFFLILRCHIHARSRGIFLLDSLRPFRFCFYLPSSLACVTKAVSPSPSPLGRAARLIQYLHTSSRLPSEITWLMLFLKEPAFILFSSDTRNTFFYLSSD